MGGGATRERGRPARMLSRCVLLKDPCDGVIDIVPETLRFDPGRARAPSFETDSKKGYP